MNVFELLFFVALSVGLFVFGRFLSKYWKPADWLVGAPIGLFWAWVLVGIIRGAVIQVRHSLSPRPICRQGKCQPRDYILITSTPEKAVFRCRCGDRYLSKGAHFSQILPDHSLLPYMVLDSARSWKTDY